MAQSGWRIDTGGRQQVEDEFACPAVLHAPLLDLKPTVERVFGVALVFAPHSVPREGQIWIQLRGRREGTDAAKLFIKGVVRQEAQEELEFPSALHAVFCGGFFTDCLIRNTSAHILVGSPGSLLIHGLEEPVVKAYSLILDLLERYAKSQSQRGPRRSETLDSQLAFRSLVEQLDDRFTLDLLVLPGLVKEVLLDLASQAGLEPEAPGERRTGESLPENPAPRQPGGPESSTTSNGTRGFPEGEDQSRIREPKEPSLDAPPEPERGTQEVLPSAKSEQEHEHLLQFFTAMGFDKEVVCGVLSRTGPREPSQVLDLIQREQNHTRPSDLNGPSGAGERDFVLDVLKKAAASCGYTEDNVDEIFSNLPELSPHEMILELQRKTTEEPGARREVPPEAKMGLMGLMGHGKVPSQAKTEVHGKVPSEAKTSLMGHGKVPPEAKTEVHGKVPSEAKTSLMGHGKPQVFKPQRSLAETSKPNPVEQAGGPEDVSSGAWTSEPSSDPSPPVCGPPRTVYPQQIPAPPQQTTPRPKAGPVRAGTVITGQQRFLEGLRRNFRLQLNDDPGDPGLRQIIIDGSNVAMTHGLGVFFSCRGIALAVQFFWARGHRRITALVPQWRQKRDPRIKEQTFMNQLQDLGLLSFTPSREVQGQRINSYDDRFMLQLARSTDGIIITNDNMRDLVEESPVWREIVKTRLLQYVFAGDLFMVPDDPLGRGGPHIDRFLQSHDRASVPVSHSFAGVSSSPAPAHPRAQTVPLQYRDRTPVAGSQHQGGSAGPRTVQESRRMEQELLEVFPGQEGVIRVTLQRHPALTDTNQLSYYILQHISTQEE